MEIPSARPETVVLVEKEDGIGEFLLNTISAILFCTLLTVLVFGIAILGIILTPFILCAALLDNFLHKDKYENTNRDKRETISRENHADRRPDR